MENKVDIKKEALKLAAANREAEPNIRAIYWFPAEDEVRLVETEDDTVPAPSEDVEPFYFSAAPEYDVHAISAIAVIRPEEVGKLKLPPGWGTWKDAILMEETK